MNPFRIGDEVVFAPDERTVGWSWATLERVRLKPGDVGIITRILPLLSVLVLYGCAVSSKPNYFPVREQRFDLQADGTGNLTHVEIKISDQVTVNSHSFDTLGGVDLRFTKDADYQMSETGTPNATMDYIVKPSSDGQWTGSRAIVSWQNPGYPTTTILIEFNNLDNVSKLIIPPAGSPSGTNYGYGSDSYGGYTPNGFVAEHIPMPISLDDVDDPLKCSIEAWSFAPNIGLVEVDTKWVPLPCEPYCPAGTPVPPLPPSLRRIN